MLNQPYLKRNFILNTLDGVSFFLGMIFLSAENVLPVFLSQLGASRFLISLIPAIRNLGVFFPSIFVARRIQGLVRQKAWLVKSGLLQRLPWLFSGLFCYYFASDFPGVAVFSIIAALFLTSLGAGISTPSFFYYTAKTIPVSLRGQLFALRNLLSYLIGFFCGAFISWILSTLIFPLNFSVLMLIGFAILMTYLPVFYYQVEPDARQTVQDRGHWKEYFQKLGMMLSSDRDLRNYIGGRIFFTLSFAANNYFAVYLVTKFNLSESAVGLFAIITAGVFLAANPLLGILADKKGHLFNHYLGSVALIIASAMAVFSQNYIFSLSTVALGAFVLCVQNVSCYSLPMEFGEDHEIPVYVGLVGLFLGVTSLLIVGFAFIAESFGYPPVFMICLVSALLSLVFFLNMTEPRRKVTPPVRDV